MDQTPFAAGYNAYFTDQQATCPFVALTARAEWLAGWREAEAKCACVEDPPEKSDDELSLR